MPRPVEMFAFSLVVIHSLLILNSAHLLNGAKLESEIKGCLPSSIRVDCHPDEGATEERCVSRGCVWCPAEDGAPEGSPWCFTPPDYGYKMVGSAYETPVGIRVNLTRDSLGGSYFGDDFNQILVDFEFWEDTHLRIKIYPNGVSRYEVPLKLEVPPPTFPAQSRMYEIHFTEDPVFSFQVMRRSSRTVIFDTSLGGLTFGNQFIQFSTKLPSTNVYGIGENEQHSFRHQFNKFQKFAVFARDQAPDGPTNLYGVQPHYTVIESDGNAHSVMIVNSNAIFLTIGGLLDIHLFLGPTPDNTAQQFTKVVGRAHIPPYWALGFQLCRWGYNNLENMTAAVDRTSRYGIPHDVQYGDIDIMDKALDFTISQANFGGLPDYVRALKERGIKFITILDPGISPFLKPEETPGVYRPFDLANEMEAADENGEKIWIRRPDGTPTMGSVWPGPTYFPDFSTKLARDWWITLIVEFKQLIDYDGLWIDMNEPASWGVGDLEQGCNMTSNYNNPPYIPGIKGGNLADFTLCPDAQQKFGLHYDTHSLYGWSQSEPTMGAVREALGTRAMVLTRSTFLGVGKWAAHWLGDNFSRWSNLHYSIIGILSFNLFGVPFVGADICGFHEEANPELCHRWQQLGAFYPFARNHNGLGNRDQDPGFFGETVANASREALEIRYTLLPYMNTQFYLHNSQGSIVVRSLGFEFPSDTEALGVDTQFLWGSGFLVSPVLAQGATSVVAYFPEATWYEYRSGAKLGIRQGYTTLSAPLDMIPLHLRGGVIFPTQKHGINTEVAKQNPFGLIIALDDSGQARGQLYLDNGESIEPLVNGQYFLLGVTAANGTCTGQVAHEGFDVTGKFVSTVRLLGAGKVDTVTVGDEVHDIFYTDPASGEVRIESLHIPLDIGFQIKWF